jgi:hypothetical protein
MVWLILPFLFFQLLLSLAFPCQPEVEPLIPEYGFTFAPRYAVSLGLEPKEAYVFLLDELKPASVRIPIYWDEAQPEKEVLDLDLIKWLIKEAEKRDVSVVLALGHTLFRAPECYAPPWANSLDEAAFKKALLSFIKRSVYQLSGFEAVEAWQLENEHNLSFFHPWCRLISDEFLKEEIELVRKTDPKQRPIVITFGGPSRVGTFWQKPIEFGNIFAVSFFNKSWNQYVPLYLNPFITRNFLMERAAADRLGKQFWISEMQAEPWPPMSLSEAPPEVANESMNPQELEKKLRQLEKWGGAERIYFWGVEWWYKELLEGRPEMIEEGKEIFHQSR